LWVRNPDDHRFTFVSQRGTTLLGWSQDEWLPPGVWVERVPPEDRELALASTERAVALGLDHEVTYRFGTADGRWVHLHDRVSAPADHTGRTVRLQGMSIDVTERVRIEQRVNQYADIVERIDL